MSSRLIRAANPDVPAVIIAADIAALLAMPPQPHVYPIAKPFPMDDLLDLVAKLKP